MKTRIAFIVIVIMVLAGKLQAQTKQQINNLATFAKVWGFLKYYHPQVAKGNPNWDEEWVKSTLTIKKIETNEEFKRFIINWYSSIPKVKLSNTITQLNSDSVYRVFNEKDIKRYNIPAGMKQELMNLYLYHQPDSSKYISNLSGPYKLDYVWHNEEAFANPAYPDEAHRLLALVRYWNIINYFYPHKKEFAPNWNKVLTDFIPQFMADKDAAEYRQTFMKLTAQIKDSHSFFVQKEWDAAHKQNPPFLVYYIDGKYIIGNSQYEQLMKKHDLRAGDEILAINGRSIDDCVKYLTPLTTGSNAACLHRNIGESLFRIDTGNTANLSTRRNGMVINQQISLYSYGDLYQHRSKNHPPLWVNMGNGVWYVRFCKITDNKSLVKMYNDIKDAKSMIWEMRDYPYFPTVQAFLPGLIARRVANEVNYDGELFYPGMFKAKVDQIPLAPDTLKLPLYKGKLIVLVNEFTQSLAESVAAELSNRPNTIVVGRQTAGATGNMLFTDFPGGIEDSYTAVKVVGLNNSFKQGQGVKLDKKISLSIKRMQSSPDYELQQAYLEAVK
ncbi:hypothetical protein FFF34_007535 [Inquilinus sp. KBS0705]|nr:hypothetical protein FFF34_007535 [Inquilinus sp. KBS0705]